MVKIATTARGLAQPATEEEIAKEDSKYFLATDGGSFMLSDLGDSLVPNTPDFGYTHTNLHRRIDDDPIIPAGSNYPFVVYDKYGNPYKQSVKIGVWDGLNSYRTTTTYTHDEESTTCEIP